MLKLTFLAQKLLTYKAQSDYFCQWKHGPLLEWLSQNCLTTVKFSFLGSTRAKLMISRIIATSSWVGFCIASSTRKMAIMTRKIEKSKNIFFFPIWSHWKRTRLFFSIYDHGIENKWDPLVMTHWKAKVECLLFSSFQAQIWFRKAHLSNDIKFVSIR